MDYCTSCSVVESTRPWWTPCLIVKGGERVPSHFATEVKSVYRSYCNSQSALVIPSKYSLLSRRSWSTTSKAFCISNVGTTSAFLDFLASAIHSDSIRAVSIDNCPAVNPFCRRDCDWSKVVLCCLFRTCSTTFKMTVIPQLTGSFLSPFLMMGVTMPSFRPEGTCLQSKIKLVRFLRY